MFKSSSLDAYWQDRPAAYFTIVRTVGTRSGVIPCAYHTLGRVQKCSISEPVKQTFVYTLEHTGQKLSAVDEPDTAVCGNPGNIQDNREYYCTVCQQLFEPSDLVISFDNGTYHTLCFCCGKCGCMVDSSTQFLLLDNGEPLCHDCSPMCHVCSKRIINGHVGVLNKDFHEECIKCFHCDKVKLENNLLQSLLTCVWQ